MENYRKAGVVEQPCPCPFPDLPADTPEVRVRDGSKIRNLMKFALSRMEGKAAESSGAREEAEPNAVPGQTLCRQIVFTGMGPSVAKAITCVEILKRRIRGLHQFTRLLYRTVQETWEPLEPAAGLDSLTVSRNVPGIWVLLSRELLDCSQPGYQAPGSFDALWAQAAKEEVSAAQRHGQRRKQGGGSGGRSGAARGKGPRKQAGRPREGRKVAGQAASGQQ
ncbi:ribonuclease P protein subunit p25-like protein [Electrophorus electricus]|uniref:ribonuclease P protein subunit p25-like protein n=1 Tax=Electrophorus electricus TaxID=8005 RepID=UPI0015CFA149|nr:ribonuclease P protein subunit p25-like protein [Electrophorus electricus]XP_026861071.2 ribonuclease P protein subunit p25-like protein [Electrophorus electricus]XP_026861072.2 ribonuclease P protein subunit p25-like protein [Electrophorus electricus]XP_026861073.2 ribonuclease P protein subunit p25-like protein [Electrophorus electricus]